MMDGLLRLNELDSWFHLIFWMLSGLGVVRHGAVTVNVLLGEAVALDWPAAVFT